MYLSKLEIFGFKSFAQKVNLAFDSGISAIVGPNGCGKTNIVDAIRWVLGEQRYSALRSDKMEDVIFNGTKGRKPLGMAEVSLVIENTRRILPSEYTQITVGRRVYRSGESEYLLNKVPCRLKDILDLFMDTGMGADAYSVIELRMVETILSDRTDERRRLFEEAAGVTRYKHQRRAALRKLEGVQSDLLRVNDIVAEVQKAVSSLERQARKAEQFNSFQGQLRALEVDLMEREYAHIVDRRRPLEQRLSSLQEEKARLDRDTEGAESEKDRHRDRLVEAENRLGNAQSDHALHLEEIHRVEEKNLVAAERARSLRSYVTRLSGEETELFEERRLQEGRISDFQETVNRLRAQEETTRAQLQSRQKELREFEAGLDSKKSDLQILNDSIIALVHKIADSRSSVEGGRERIQSLDVRIRQAHDESNAYEAEKGRLDEAITALTADDRSLRRSFAEAEMRFYEADGRKKGLKQESEDLERAIMSKRSEIQRLTARLDLLKSLVESREGFSEGVRHLARSEKWKSARPITVADAVRAEKEYRSALEAALGEFAGCLVVQSTELANEGIALLKQDQKGKATFVSLDRLPEIRAALPVPRIRGVIGWASTLADYDPVYTQLFRLMLDRTLVVDTIETAKHVVASFSGVRCVTLDGEIITGLGVTRGGGRREDEGGMIGKQQQVEELTRGIELLQGEIRDLEDAQQKVRLRHDDIDLPSLAETVKSIEKEMNAAEMRIAQLEFEKKRALEIIEKNSGDVDRLRQERKQLETEIEERLPAVESFRTHKADGERLSVARAQEISVLENEWNERSRAVQSLDIAIVQISGDLQNALNGIARAQEALDDVDQDLQRHRRDIQSSSEEIGSIETAVGDHASQLEEFIGRRQELERNLDAVRDEAKSIRSEIHRIELHLKDIRRTSDETLKMIHDHELRITDLNGKADHLIARAREEFDHVLELKSYPENEFVDFAALRDKIQSLRNRIKGLGNINFAAFEEYSAEKQRLEFLTAQRADLLEAEKTLLATIEEINATAQRKFLDTFEMIRQNFILTFKSLFDPGDECDLKLEEDVDPLEAGIEITAKPRGKRPTSIDLLSGGEKTLTAIALLFAIYLVKPSPFCILDEVDAPLDDANIDRFTRILRKFSDKTQFIVVTHNKRTMESANALYGVTMEEEGVSKIVTVRFSQTAQIESAAIATG